MLAPLKTAWQKLAQQPGSVHLLLAGGLMLLTIFLLSPGAPDAGPDLREGLAQNSADQADSQPEHATPVEAPSVTALVPSAETNEITPPASPVLTPQAEPVVTPQAVPGPAPASLVLIIDDIGYNADAGRRAINLPGAVTYAVIPYTPHGKSLAEYAHQADKEVMLHAPMSNLSGMDLGQGGLTLLQNEHEFLHTLQLALAEVPHIKGVNNHTGSELTAAIQPMQWLMQELKGRGLYFVDSVTTNASVAATTAEQFQVPSLRRHVFLDNVQNADAIDAEFRRALALAQKQGFAVAIGHPYPETLAYLERALPLLAEQNIQLVSASAMIATLQNQAEEKSLPADTTTAW